MGLHVHRSERTDVLLAGLAEVLARAPADPFAVDLVAVPTPGIERYLSQGLARTLGATPGRTDGVCANLSFASPARLADEVIARATGVTPDTDPWLAHRMVWPLLAVIDASADQAWCRSLARHLEHRDRRFATASRLTGLFGSYASQRPRLLTDWARGPGPDGHDRDGAGGRLASDLAWQAELWRGLRTRIDAPSPAERLASACAAVRADPDLVDLPERLSVFGPSRLPADQLSVLAALSAGREVHLWLADPSPILWREVSAAPILWS
ncbi:MAG: exodeoxyribonuclease V subunit gamma, partial [Candidatus Nanopelagicales bacterium]